MQYAVHLYPTVRIKVVGIEANSPAEAMEKAEGMVNLHDILDDHRPAAPNVENVEWDEGENNFVLVDPLDENGELIEEDCQWLDGNGHPLEDGKTLIERKAAAADEANLFMQELTGSVGELIDIANEHGTRTLVDLMDLQAAILSNGVVDHGWPESSAMEIASSLPSGDRWLKFIQKECVAQRETI